MDADLYTPSPQHDKTHKVLVFASSLSSTLTMYVYYQYTLLVSYSEV